VLSLLWGEFSKEAAHAHFLTGEGFLLSMSVLSSDMCNPVPNVCVSVLPLCRKIPGNVDTDTKNLLENKFNFLSLKGH